MEKVDILIWGFLLGMVLMYVGNRQYRLYKRKKYLKRAKKAERDAIGFLEKRGYHILERQLTRTLVIYLNGKPHESRIRADLLVRKGWKTYVVEVKSGQQGSGTLPNVRRQLLEYDLVFRPDGMLLLDMEKEQLKTVEFDYGVSSTWREKILVLCLAASLIMIGVLWVQGR